MYGNLVVNPLCMVAMVISYFLVATFRLSYSNSVKHMMRLAGYETNFVPTPPEMNRPS